MVPKPRKDRVRKRGRRSISQRLRRLKEKQNSQRQSNHADIDLLLNVKIKTEILDIEETTDTPVPDITVETHESAEDLRRALNLPATQSHRDLTIKSEDSHSKTSSLQNEVSTSQLVIDLSTCFEQSTPTAQHFYSSVVPQSSRRTLVTKNNVSLSGTPNLFDQNVLSQEQNYDTADGYIDSVSEYVLPDSGVLKDLGSTHLALKNEKSSPLEQVAANVLTKCMEGRKRTRNELLNSEQSSKHPMVEKSIRDVQYENRTSKMCKMEIDHPTQVCSTSLCLTPSNPELNVSESRNTMPFNKASSSQYPARKQEVLKEKIRNLHIRMKKKKISTRKDLLLNIPYFKSIKFDPDLNFLLSLLPFLKSLPPSLRTKAKAQIKEIFLEAEQSSV